MQVHSAIIICLAFLYIGVSASTSSEGCAAPPVLPKKPFFVVWNHPSAGCERSGHHIGFEEWGIVDNTKDKFMGEKMTLFYGLGQWPNIKADGTRVNGGIPQLANLTLHFNKVEADINKLIPDTSFSGLGVIDMESWRAIWETNYSSFRKYQGASRNLVKQKFPAHAKDSKWVQAEAAKEWNAAARKIMGDTLKLAMKLRPQGKWGFYGYPRPWSGPAVTVRVNDQMEWIWNTSSGIYPSIYFNPQKGEPAQHALQIKTNLAEALRVKAKFSKNDAPILPYTLSQKGAYYLFTKDDLELSIGQPANMGSSGVVIWGSSGDFHRPNACNVLKDYVKNTLGPYVLKLTNFFSSCTEKLCHGNGRCVRKDYERIYQDHLKASGRTECLIDDDKLAPRKINLGDNKTSRGNIFMQTLTNPFLFKREFKLGMSKWSNKGPVNHNINHKSETYSKVRYDFDDYVCKCFKGWSGDNCDKKG